jgi:hypothetical protein
MPPPSQTIASIEPPPGHVSMALASERAFYFCASLSPNPPRSTLNDASTAGAWVTVTISISGVLYSILRSGGTIAAGRALDDNNDIADGAGVYLAQIIPQPPYLTNLNTTFEAWLPNILIRSARPRSIIADDAGVIEPPPSPNDLTHALYAASPKTHASELSRTPIWNDVLTLGDAIGVEPPYLYLVIKTDTGYTSVGRTIVRG